ncbi:MAG: hypothetical protein ACLGH8_11460 [Bacteroidia bacterium]
METTFHFSSADDSFPHIPSWQIKETLKRQQYIKDHPESLIDFDEMMDDLISELL